MATRSNIGMQQSDGTIKAIYCHWDGYPAGVGATLAEHYTDPAKVEALINLGDFSSLEPNIEDIQTYAQRGETGTEAREFARWETWKDYALSQSAEYLYLFEQDPYNGWGWNYYALGDNWVSLPSTKQVANA